MYEENREMYKVTCADCGKETEVPFKPDGSRPVYCKECFQKHKPKRFQIKFSELPRFYQSLFKYLSFFNSLKYYYASWVIDFYRINCYEIVCNCGGEMGRVGTKYKEVIELFDEKTGDVVRVLRFRNSIAFDEFLKDFKAMRYPGYGWRCIDKGKKKGKNE